MNTLSAKIPFQSVSEGDEMPEIDDHSLIIDAIFGTGLNRSVKGYWADLICYVNDIKMKTISVDLPSGMLADFYTDGISIQADEVICLESPKLGLFMSSNLHRFEDVMHERIGLSIMYAIDTHTDHFLTEKSDIYILLKNRYKTDHKGRFGHALMFSGKEGMMGAAILAAKACMRTGVGKCTVHVPSCGRDVLQMSIPEAMVSVDANEKHISKYIDFEDFSAIGIGCGIGTHRETAAVLAHLFETADKPLVLDADALNILAQNQELLTFIPKGTIITPHIKEFDRLFGNSPNDFVRLDLQKSKSKEYGIVIVLKGHHTTVSDEKGTVYINTTGNVGMATAGSGDVLTGMICSLLAQGYVAHHAAKVGVYLHGLAGDVAQNQLCAESMIASDIVDNIHKAFDIARISEVDDLFPF
jgi:NAD(P)H-hydrate epimerase